MSQPVISTGGGPGRTGLRALSLLAVSWRGLPGLVAALPAFCPSESGWSLVVSLLRLELGCVPAPA